MSLDELLEALGGNARACGDGYVMACPAHDDKRPSLSVGEGANGAKILKCHAGCPTEAVLAAIGLDFTAMYPQRAAEGDWTPGGPALAHYPYTDADGHLLFEVVRCSGKGFFQRRPDPSRKSGWVWHLGDVERPLYRLPQVCEAIKEGSAIFVVEGERDVHTCVGLGVVATCNPGGAGKWRPQHAAALRGADVIVVADRDDAGYRHARAVRDSLKGVAKTLRMVEPLVGKDATDHVAAKHALEELVLIWPSPLECLDVKDIHDFVVADDLYDWLVPGLLERGDRLLLTGWEGLGKSTLLAQLAVTFAAGIHPFRTAEHIEPLRVLLVDCENSERQMRRRLRPLLALADRFGRPVPRQSCFPISRLDGLDLGGPEDRAWLSERAMAYKPDVLLIGPLYKLHDDDLKDEQVSKAIATTLDQVRAEARCCIVIEAHAGHGDSEQMRSVRPIGSSLWLRWPEFGYGIRATKETSRGTPVEFRAWRGPRDERDWPFRLHRSKPWPWAGEWVRTEATI